MKLVFRLCALVLLTNLAFTFNSSAQFDYQIPKGVSEGVKHKYQMPPNSFATKELPWGSIASECAEEPVKAGLWLAVKVKSGQTRITITSTGKKGGVESPTLFFTEVISDKKGRRLSEIKCVKFDGLQKEYSIEATGLNPEGEYFMLLGTNVKGQRFGIEVTEKFAPKSTEQNVETAIQKTHSIVGRVRQKDGSPKRGVRISLLNGLMKKVTETETADDGSFVFEKLPKDEVFLTRLEEEDTDLLVDVFLRNSEGEVTSRATKVGDNMFGFGADSDSFKDLKLLTELDWKINVIKGKMGVSGRVVDAATFLYGRKNLTIELFNATKTKVANTTTNADGNFQFKDLALGKYEVKIANLSAADYGEIVLVDDLNVPYSYSNSNMLGADGAFKFEKLPMEMVELKRLEEKDSDMPLNLSDFGGMQEGKAIILKNILFESGSAQLKATSNAELDQLAKELKSRPQVNIEISGHTDNVGNEATNKLLSKNRADAVKAYLVDQGIAASRLSTIGLGSAKAMATNDTEEGRKQNRRVEFVVK
jgi:outer membrane protein OmpA-like peptidoglycan-associated protein